jgi:DNA-binding HxlR family transcriptional regulator
MWHRSHQMTENRCEERVCPVAAAARLLGSVWSLVVINYLMDGPMGFNELLRQIPGLNSKTLSRTLKSLQAKGLVIREVVNTQPFAVRYVLTPAAKELKPVVHALSMWGSKWMLGSGLAVEVQAGRGRRAQRAPE